MLLLWLLAAFAIAGAYFFLQQILQQTQGKQSQLQEQMQQTQESLAMLKILALSTKNIKEGNYNDAESIFSELDKKIGE